MTPDAAAARVQRCQKDEEENKEKKGATVMLFEETEEGEGGINALQGNRRADSVRISTVMDSGSSDHCISRSAVPEIPIQPSEGSRRGQVYSAAGGKGIPNEGEQQLPLLTEDGASAPLVFQVAEVRKPLCSVARLCDRGNRITFGRGGGVVQNLNNGKCTRFKRQGSIYALDLWLNPDAPLPRQGR